MTVGAHMIVLFVIKVKIILLVKVAIQLPPLPPIILIVEFKVVYQIFNT